MLLIEHGNLEEPPFYRTSSALFGTGIEIRRLFKHADKWHIGQPLPPVEGSVARFVADGDELCLILGTLREQENDVRPIRLHRSANGWIGTLQLRANRAVSVERPSIELVLGSLVLEHATAMGFLVTEDPIACVKCGRTFTTPSEYRFRGADGKAICRKPCREVAVVR